VTLATLFTIARIILIPVFGLLWAKGQNDTALWVFVAAAVTDILDGLIARALHQHSRLGAILDPAADKLLLLVGYLVGTFVGAVPLWLAALVIGRDVLVAFGAGVFAWILRGRHDPDQWRPSRIGKYAMFVQSLTIALALYQSVFEPRSLRPWLEVTMLVAGALTLASGIQYVGIGLRACLASPQAAGREAESR
jgi:cardiolipin synthase (CMP-forming)